MSTEEGSVSFDRAAEYYDDTRSLSDEVERSVVALAEQLEGRRRCLEIGVGTGRMALPLHDLGFELFGVDLSMPMMSKLRTKSGGSLPFPLVQADAGRLCFQDASFDGAYAVWVLHLITGWRSVLDELLRAVKPGGVMVVAMGGSFGRGPWAEITNRFRAVARATHLGANDISEIDAAMTERGCETRFRDQLLTTHSVTPAEILKRLEERTYSFTWRLDARTLTGAVATVRTWARERYTDLDAPVENRFGAVWRSYLLPG